MPETPPPQEFNTAFDLITVVLRLSPVELAELEALNFQFTPEDIDSLEEELDGALQITQTVGPTGPTLSVAVQSRQLDLSIAPARIEVRSQKPEFSESTARSMVSLMNHGLQKYGAVDCQSIGHNFLSSLRSPQGSAIEHIQRKLMKDGLDRRIGNHNVLGASAALWIEVEDSLLVLKIDPTRGNKTNTRYRLNANFSVDLDETANIPDSERFVERLLLYCRRFESITEGLGL